MREEQKNLMLVLGNYLIFTALTGLGGYLFILYPQNEALGGMILGLAGVLLGIICPLHLRRMKNVEFKMLPSKRDAWSILLSTVIFTAGLVFLYPSGILGNKASMKFLAQPPAFASALMTFAFLLVSATIYALLFWGGILHAIRKTSGSIAAVIVTSLLFSLYHIAEFAFTPLTLEFFAMMFISGLLCTTFTLYSKSVLPTLVAQQFGQFMHFASLEENPFGDPAGLISNAVLLGLCLGIYTAISRKLKGNIISEESRV